MMPKALATTLKILSTMRQPCLTIYIALFFIGFANALPIPLMGSVLSIWLTEQGFDKVAIGSFALLGIPFSLKLLWTPVIDHIHLPFLSNRQRKGWLLVSLSGISGSFLWMSTIEPSQTPFLLIACILSLSFFKGCLYMAGIAYELESLDEKAYSIGSSCVITGYRIGLLIAGAGALYLSAIFSWSVMFKVMALTIGLGCLAIIFQGEPYKAKAILEEKRQKISRYRSVFIGFISESLVQPLRSFFQKSDWKLILALVVLFKLGDHATKSMSGPFYLSLGFTKIDLANADKIWGMIATLIGAFFAGFFLKGKNHFHALGKFGLIHACSLICHSILSITGKSFFLLYLTVAMENLTGGMAICAFIYFLWKVCEPQHAAVQYALLWSCFTIKAEIVAFFGGIFASSYSWNIFFPIITFFGMLSAITVWRLSQPMSVEKAA